jgi:predicted CXXCH cytochrome family protein
VAHHAGSDLLLWAHTLSSETITFGTKASTYAGTDLSTVTITSASEGNTKLCLSCHDGTVAVGDRTLLQGTTVITAADWATPTGTFLTGEVVIPTGTAGSLSLSRTHPVRVPYQGQTYNSVTSQAVVAGYQGFTPASGNISSVGGAMLFKDSGGGWGLECGTCHNPHSAGPGPLLRPNTSGSICTDCHIK